MRGWWLLLVPLVAAGCAGGEAAEPEAPAPEPEVVVDEELRPRPYPVAPPPEFQRAIDAETRTTVPATTEEWGRCEPVLREFDTWAETDWDAVAAMRASPRRRQVPMP